MNVKWISTFFAAAMISPLLTQASPNPAAKMCLQLKGEYLSEGSLCKIGDGVIGAWTLFRQVAKGSKGNQEAVDAFLRRIPIKKPIPADAPDSEWCAVVAGKLEAPLCKFSDGSEIFMETLKGGEEKYPELAKTLELKDQMLADENGQAMKPAPKKSKGTR